MCNFYPMNKNLLPDIIDVNELMEVKGGKREIDVSPTICVFAAAVKCTVAGSGVIVAKHEEPTEPIPADPYIEDGPMSSLI